MKRKILFSVMIMLCVTGLSSLAALPVTPQAKDALTKTYTERGYFVYSNSRSALPFDIYTIYYCIDGTCQENLPPCTVLEFKEKPDTESKRYEVYIAYTAQGEDKQVLANQLFTGGIYIVEHQLKKAQYLVMKNPQTKEEIVIMLADQS